MPRWRRPSSYSSCLAPLSCFRPPAAWWAHRVAQASLPRADGRASREPSHRPADALGFTAPFWLTPDKRTTRKATRLVGVLQAMSLPPQPAPIATGWSDSCRAGFAPAEGRCLSTAHRKRSGSPVVQIPTRRRRLLSAVELGARLHVRRRAASTAGRSHHPPRLPFQGTTTCVGHSHPRSRKAARSTPGGAYHPFGPYRAPSRKASSLFP